METSAQSISPEPQQTKLDGSLMRKCDFHGEYQVKTLSVFGEQRVFDSCPQCAEERRQRQDEEIRERVRQQRITAFLRGSGIPFRFRQCTIAGFSGDTKGIKHARSVARRYVDEFEGRLNRGTALIFCGKPGTGKTHLACAVGLELIRSEHSVVYTTEYRLTRSIKETYGRDSGESEEDLIRGYRKPPLLIIDEVGVSRGSETDHILLYEVLNGRYERLLPCLLIGNLTLDEMTAHLGERVMDRMRDGGGAIVAFDWQSYRK